MANVNLSLDDIIKTKRGGPKKGSRVGRSLPGFKRPLAGRRDKYFSDDTPSGKWKHDKYLETYGGGASKKRGGIGGARLSKRARGGDLDIVKLNISNLPATVVTSDLEELFQDFGVYGVTVHYDETGAHLGTADLFTNPASARSIIREYANIAIDGQEIVIGIVDESGMLKPRIKDRINRIRDSPVRRRGAGGGGVRRNAGGRIAKRGGGGGPKSNAGGAKVKKMTVEELDKELEAYMSSKK